MPLDYVTENGVNTCQVRFQGMHDEELAAPSIPPGER
jgi:hypothetical protein